MSAKIKLRIYATTILVAISQAMLWAYLIGFLLRQM